MIALSFYDVGDLFPLLITFANKLYPDQNRHNVDPDR